MSAVLLAAVLTHCGSDGDPHVCVVTKTYDCGIHDAGAPSSAGRGGEGQASAGTASGAAAGGERTEPVSAGAGGADNADQAWLTEPSSWKVIAQADFLKPTCVASAAVAGKLRFEKLSWQTCGGGCESADVVQGYSFDGKGGFLPRLSTSVANGKPRALLAIRHPVKQSGRLLSLARTVDLDSGITLGALQLEQVLDSALAACTYGGSSETAASLTILGGAGMDADSRYALDAVAPLTAGEWTFAAPAVTIAQHDSGLMGFDVEVPEPLTFWVGLGGVLKQTAVASSKLEPLELSSHSYIGAGQADLAVWTDYDDLDAPRVRGWAPDGKGVRTLIEDPPAETCEVVASPDHLVALAVTHPASSQARCGPGTKVTLWQSPRGYDTTETAVDVGPELPGSPFYHELRSWGDYAAVRVTPAEETAPDTYRDLKESYFAVVQLSTGKKWRVNAPNNHGLRGDAFTLTPTYLYFAENDDLSIDRAYARRVVRIELEKLSEYGAVLQ